MLSCDTQAKWHVLRGVSLYSELARQGERDKLSSCTALFFRTDLLSGAFNAGLVALFSKQISHFSWLIGLLNDTYLSLSSTSYFAAVSEQYA